jgi:type VI secretion system protein ImpH
VSELSPAERLEREPELFELDEAIAILAYGRTRRELRFRTTANLSHAPSAIVQADPDGLTLATFGLLGPGGALPLYLTATVAAEHRKRSGALHDFIDMLGGRFVALWAEAGIKYRPTSNPLPAGHALTAAIGLLTRGLETRTGVPLSALLFHAGNLSAQTRSAERLTAMLEAEVDGPVELVEFAGGWMRLPETERTRLGSGEGGETGRGQHATLGAGAALGEQTWDPTAGFIVSVGPLRRAAFESLLPGQPEYQRLVALLRLAVGLDTSFVLNPILDRRDMTGLHLWSSPNGPRLGWSSWLTTLRPGQIDGRESMLPAR